MQSALSPASGLCNSTKQQLITPQQMTQTQHWTAHRNHTTQVQFQNILTTSNLLTQPPDHYQYDISFPPLPKQNENPWTKVEYKKPPRDTPENHMKHEDYQTTHTQ
jgi:hypothetical protein